MGGDGGLGALNGGAAEGLVASLARATLAPVDLDWPVPGERLGIPNPLSLGVRTIPLLLLNERRRGGRFLEAACLPTCWRL